MKKDLPLISVIMPAYNAEETIEKAILSLLNLNYPKERIELLIVDNNSSDSTVDIIGKYPVTLLQECEKQSSYAARNLGVKVAKGEIYAFTDADCIVDVNWVMMGIEALQKADLVGGKVEFIYSEKKTSSEMYDSLISMDNELYILSSKGATTANLFVKSSIFSKIGLFDDTVVSGGDMEWTIRASNSGYKIEYSNAVIIRHPSRKFKDLMAKGFRVGTGFINIWRKSGLSSKQILSNIFRLCIPTRPYYIRKMVKRRGTTDMYNKIAQVWLVAYLSKLSRITGILFSLVSRRNKNCLGLK